MSRKTLIGVVAIMMLIFVPLSVVAHSGHDTEPAVEFRLQENGDSDATFRLTYDLNNTNEQEAFKQLQNDEDSKQQLKNTTEKSFTSVVNSVDSNVDRNMSLENTTMTLETVDNATGIVEIKYTWVNFAETSNGQLSFQEPLASGFESDRKVTVYVPDGYEVTSVSPEPTAEQESPSEEDYGTRLVWESETSLNGFNLEASPQSPDLPGFGIPVAILAIITVSLYSRRGN